WYGAQTTSLALTPKGRPEHPLDAAAVEIAALLRPYVDLAGHYLDAHEHAALVARVKSFFAPIDWINVNNDIWGYFSKIMVEHGETLPKTAAREIFRDCVEKLSFFVESHAIQMRKGQESSDQPQNYQLPDGQIISSDDPRFRAPSVGAPGVPDIAGVTSQAVLAATPSDRAPLFENVVLTGGGTLGDGVERELERTLAQLAPAGTRVQVTAPRDRDLAWVGAARCAASPAVMRWAVTTRAEYRAHVPPGA
ncbi:hypothetical protein L6R52_37040, partial [Myxococcota bacterium]|nr:hypothetical protein [Myxococcota bacterium]